MINLQDFIAHTTVFKKCEVDDLLFVEIICPVEDEEPENSLWWHNNFFSYAIAGEMALKTLRGEYSFKAGECIFAKKGSIIAARHLRQEDFCELRVFVPDHFIKSVFQKYSIPIIAEAINEKTDTIIPVMYDEVLEVYFHSLLTYFRQPTPPPGTLLKLRFEELVMHIASSNVHQPLKCYFSELCSSTKPSIKSVMEENFFCNLSLDEFARLCTRSLSAFKQEFKNIFHTTPGKWLLEKRLEYSKYLLDTTDSSIDEICLVSGFENRSHFIRVFKSRYGFTPGKMKLQEKPGFKLKKQ
jgi:AraC-like DNA-binding protein